ncbi:MAG: hydantoinase/oxoprolinase family protein, partial [Opitutales bacterium]
LRIDAPWHAPDDFPAGFTVFFPAQPDFRGKISEYQATSRKILVEEDLPFVPVPGEPVELVSGWEAPILAARLAMATQGIGLGQASVTLRLATTRCTNALLERKGIPPVFFVTRGFRDLLRIGDQRRLGLFDLCPRKRQPLHGDVVEVKERLDRAGTVIEPLDLETLREPIQLLLDGGCRVAAISLLHSHANPEHENALAEFLGKMGFEVVASSAALRPFAKWLPRAESAVVEAYLTPVLSQYLRNVASEIAEGSIRVMTSAGGLVGTASYRAIDSLLSGPAGGVVGAVAVSRRAGLDKIIALDMGGTSTDVSRFDADFDYSDRHVVGEVLVSAPALRIETVAAGGGSVCRLDGELLAVGPGSAGARPGPACYGFGGPLCLTDVNLLLGRLEPSLFAIPVFPEESEGRLAEILAGSGRSREETLFGFLEVANDLMAGAIRKISVREGYDPSEYALVAFGGAGGQHACGVAEKLGITRVLSPADAGLLSAYGLSRASLERIAERQVLGPLNEELLLSIEDELREEALAALEAEGIAVLGEEIRRKTAFLRYQGQDAPLEVDYQELADLQALFESRYTQVFGYLPS